MRSNAERTEGRGRRGGALDDDRHGVLREAEPQDDADLGRAQGDLVRQDDAPQVLPGPELRSVLRREGREPVPGQVAITFSMGVAVYDEKIDQNVSDLIKRADLAVYKAKQSGRDKLVFTD